MDLDNLEIRVKTPYPKITGAKNDPSTVAILKNLATSRSSELSAILTYIYQSVIADKTHEDIAKLIEEIGIVEMTHLDMLMHAITEFGGNPRYEDAKGVPFSTTNINYATKLKEMLVNNIRGEEMAIEDYTRAIGLVRNDSLKSLFARIIEDEECHIRAFKYLLDNVNFMSV